MSPLARLNPFISASVCPSSFSLTQKASWSEYFSMISTVPSVEPPSMMMYSRLGYPCSSTLLIVASMYRPWLNEGVTTDIFGQSALLSFMLRPNSHLLRQHPGMPGQSARRRIFRRSRPESHPNIPVMRHTCRSRAGRTPRGLKAAHEREHIDRAQEGWHSSLAAFPGWYRDLRQSIFVRLSGRGSRMTMPNFFIVGAQKAGTTSLYHYLDQHPQIYMSPVKEPFFFDHELDSKGEVVRREFGGHRQPPRFASIEEYRALV